MKIQNFKFENSRNGISHCEQVAAHIWTCKNFIFENTDVHEWKKMNFTFENAKKNMFENTECYIWKYRMSHLKIQNFTFENA